MRDPPPDEAQRQAEASETQAHQLEDRRAARARRQREYRARRRAGLIKIEIDVVEIELGPWDGDDRNVVVGPLHR